jgi:hypothetical protein
MNAFTIFKLPLFLAVCLLSIGDQASTCITAGRMFNSVWAPHFLGSSDQTKRAVTENPKTPGFKNAGFETKYLVQ